MQILIYVFKKERIMMQKKTPVTCLLILVLFIAGSCSSKDDTITNWNSDIEFLKTELPKRHKDFYHLKNENDYFSGLEEISLQKDKLSDLEIAIKLQQLIAGFGDSHTKLKFWKFIDNSKALPLKLYWFSDGIYIVNTLNEHKEILGQKITQINGKTIEEAVDLLKTLITVDNNALVKSYIPELLTFPQILEYFNIIGDEVIELSLENNQKEVNQYKIEPILRAPVKKENIISTNPDSSVLSKRKKYTYFNDCYLSQSKTYYVQYNECWGKELEIKYRDKENSASIPSFTNFEENILSTIENNQIDKFVFDMRYNSGGSSSQGTELIKKLSKIEEINQKGKLFVIIGRETFSSAIINTMDFQRETNAIFAGEETGGKPNHYGEVKDFTLPYSGLTVCYSTKYFIRSEENLNTITPNYTIEESFDDYINGIDPVMDWIRNQ